MCSSFILCKHMKPCGEKKIVQKTHQIIWTQQNYLGYSFLHYHTRTYNQCKMSLTYHSGPHQI